MATPAPALTKLEVDIVVGSSVASLGCLRFALAGLWQSAGPVEIGASTIVGGPVAWLLWLGWRTPRREAPWAEALLAALLAVPIALLLAGLVMGAWMTAVVAWGLSPTGAMQATRELLPPTLAVSLPVAVAGSALLVSTLGVLWVRARRDVNRCEGSRAWTSTPPGALERQ